MSVEAGEIYSALNALDVPFVKRDGKGEFKGLVEGGQDLPLLRTQVNPVTGGSEISTPNSLLKLPAGITDLSSGVSGGGAINLGQQNTQSASPAATTEFVAYQLTIPANTVGVNDSIIVDGLLTYTNNANNKSFKLKIGGITIMDYNVSTSAYGTFNRKIRSRNSQVSQITISSAASGEPISGSLSPVASTIDFTQAQTLQLTITKATSGDFAALETITVKLEKGA